MKLKIGISSEKRYLIELASRDFKLEKSSYCLWKMLILIGIFHGWVIWMTNASIIRLLTMSYAWSDYCNIGDPTDPAKIRGIEDNLARNVFNFVEYIERKDFIFEC